MSLRLYKNQANIDSNENCDADVTVDHWHIKQWVIEDLQGQISQFVRNSTQKMYVKKNPDL